MGYLIYQEGLEKLREAGLLQRVEESEVPYFSAYTFTDFNPKETLEYFREEGFLKYVQFPFGHSFDLSVLSNEQEWSFNNSTRPISSLDKDVLSGLVASYVLTPRELWAFQDFGFQEPSQLLGTLGAHIIASQGFEKRPVPWQTQHPDGRTIETVITGSNHYDLRILQIDKTEYALEDPFGIKMLYRPLTVDHDETCLAAYHTTEGAFLVSLLKYADELKQSLNIGGLISYGDSLGQQGGGCTEHFGGYDTRPNSFFTCYEFPFPKIVNGSFEGALVHTLYTESQNCYVAVVEDNTLQFVYRDKDGNAEELASITLYPEDIIPAIQGLLAQSARGLGRTSAQQLLSILDFYRSPEFERYEFR